MTSKPPIGSQFVRRLGPAVIVLALALFVAACGGGGGSSVETGVGSTEVTEAGSGSTSDLVVEAKEVAKQATEQMMYSTVDVPTEPSQLEPYGKWRGPDSAPKHEQGKNIQIIVCTKASPACVEVAEGAEEAAKVLGWKAEIIDGEGTPQGFATAFNTAFSRNPDAIIGVAVPSAVVGKSLTEAAEKGIPTIAAADKEPESGASYDAYVSFREPVQAAVAGWMIIGETNGEANAIVINDPGFPVLVQETESLEGVLSECEGCSVTRVDQQITEAANPSKVSANIGGALASDPEANYIYTPYSIPLATLVQTVQSAGKSGSVKIAAASADRPQLTAVGEGSLSLTVGTSPQWAGWASVDQAIRGVAKEEFLGPTEIGIGIGAFTKANAPSSGSIEDWPKMIDYRKEYERVWGS